MNLEWLRNPIAAFFVGVIGTSAIWMLNPPKAVTKVETKFQDRELTTEEKTAIEFYKNRNKVKKKATTTYRKDGTVAKVETCEIVIRTEEKSTMVAESNTSESVRTEESNTLQSIAIPRYRLGVLASPIGLATGAYLSPATYTAVAGIRVGNWPLWLEGSVGGDLKFGIGLTYEF